MDELPVHTVAEVHTFSKYLEAISKESCQKSDIQEFLIGILGIALVA